MHHGFPESKERANDKLVHVAPQGSQSEFRQIGVEFPG